MFNSFEIGDLVKVANIDVISVDSIIELANGNVQVVGFGNNTKVITTITPTTDFVVWE